MTVSLVLAMALAAVIGISLGVLGGGGSIVTLPVLVYVAHVPPEEAVAMSMAIVGATSLFGVVAQARRGYVAWKPGILFSAAGMVGAYLGSGGTHLLPKKVLMLMFAALMFIVGGLMLRGGARPECGVCSTPKCLGTGFAVGVMTGFMGVGGGFLIVPALIFAGGLDIRAAAGTSLGVIALNSASGLVGQLRYAHVHWDLLGGFLFFAFVGMIAGIFGAERLHPRILRRIFAIVLLVLGVFITATNLP
ncbi:MAG: sulfite exporter TauE/SafE family protein [Acidobacteriota bacterium]|nr:sulfite exporter TauE/SafE family protein [Acidobacteriota bacterium]